MPSSIPTASDYRGIISVVTMDTMENSIWVCSKVDSGGLSYTTLFLFLGSTTLFSQLTAAFSSGLK